MQLEKESNGNIHVRLRLAAPAVEGKANIELQKSLAEFLSIRKNCVNIIRGDKSRNKLVQIEGLTEEELWWKLQAQL